MSGEDFECGIKLIREAYIEGLRHFVKWAQEKWDLEPNDKWPYADDPPPTDEYRRGYEAMLESLDMALDCYTDEFSNY